MNIRRQTWYLPRPPTSFHRDAFLRGGWPLGDSSYFKFDQNRFSGYQDFRVKIWVTVLLWPMSYTALYYCTGMIQSCAATLEMWQKI